MLSVFWSLMKGVYDFSGRACEISIQRGDRDLRRVCMYSARIIEQRWSHEGPDSEAAERQIAGCHKVECERAGARVRYMPHAQ